jgi:hypothetical protein
MTRVMSPQEVTPASAKTLIRVRRGRVVVSLPDREAGGLLPLVLILLR